MPSANLLQDVSSGAALAGTSPLPARSHASARQSSGLPDPATAADPCVADLPTGLAETLPIARGRVPATASSCTVAPRLELPLATGSSFACALAPGGAGATAVAADPGSPSSAPRSSGNHP